jgi:hypothetical protein
LPTGVSLLGFAYFHSAVPCRHSLLAPVLIRMISKSGIVSHKHVRRVHALSQQRQRLHAKEKLLETQEKLRMENLRVEKLREKQLQATVKHTPRPPTSQIVAGRATGYESQVCVPACKRDTIAHTHSCTYGRACIHALCLYAYVLLSTMRTHS